MYGRFAFFILSACVLIVAGACRKGPKVISAEPTVPPSGIFADRETVPEPPTTMSGLPSGVHRVVVQEVLPTERYVYLLVDESGRNYWIATRKQAAAPGQVFYYRDGLRKTHFESKEYGRVFDEIYLVSQLVSEAHGGGSAPVVPPLAATPVHTPEVPGTDGVPRLRIAALVADPQRYADQVVEVHGECVKLNAGIMGRNWIHLQDGSQDGYDLVITAATPVRVGTHATLRARVSLNRDFGAGYAYALILEDGVIVE
ncbi:MAG: hypothetical protein OHK0039_35480 [Bacteroidia bacterium]